GAVRLGEHRGGDLGAGEPYLVAGQGGQVVQQAAEAAVGAAGRVVLAGGLGPGGCGAAGLGDGVLGDGRVLVGEGERRPGPAQVPGEVAGEHADQHVGLDAFFQVVEDGPRVQVVGLDVAEVPLDVFGLTGVSAEAPGSSMTSRVRAPGTFSCARCPAVYSHA